MRHPLVLSALAAAIAMAAVAHPAQATTPTQLPGQGRVVSGVVVGSTDSTAGTMSLNIVGPAVINWGQGTGAGAINPQGVAGFNIGPGAQVTFNGSAGAAVLNIDSSGNASRIFGALTAKGADVFVANGNGIIVGSRARIASDHLIGLIANRLDGDAAARFASSRSLAYDGHGGDVVVHRGARFGGGEVLIAGGRNVNVDVGAFLGGVRLSAGRASSAAAAGDSDNTRATLTTWGTQRGSVDAFSSAGSATNHGTLDLRHAHLAGLFTNDGLLNLADGFAISGTLLNHGKVHAKGDITLGRLVNAGWLTTLGQLDALRQVINWGTIFSPDYKGTISAHGFFINRGRIDGLSSVGTTGGDLLNDGTIRLVDNQDPEAGGAGTAWVIGGNLVNRGQIDGPTSAGIALEVTNGHIDNTATGVLANTGVVETGSDATLAGFAPGADYSIRNEGSISGDPLIDANFYARRNDNGSTGSFINTGVIDMRSGDASTRFLDIVANNDISLGGAVTIDGQAPSSGNTLDQMALTARNGTLTIGTPLYFSTPQNGGSSYLMAEHVNVEANLVGVGSNSDLYISTHRNDDGTYALSVKPGVQLTANKVTVNALP